MRRRLLNLFALACLAFALYLTLFTKPELASQQTPMKSVQGPNGATASLHQAH